MIAVAIASIVTLGVASLVSNFQSNVSSIQNVMDFDDEAFRLQYYFTRPLRNAVNLKATTANLNSYSVPVTGANAYEGLLRTDFDSTTFANNSHAKAVAVFARDVTKMGAADAKSEFRGTAIYFQNPSLTKFGVLYISDADGAGNLAPSRTGQFVTNIVSLKISDVITDNGFIHSFTVRVLMRYPTTGSDAAINWCPVKSDCGAEGSPTKDIERKFVVNLYNNFDPAPTNLQKLPMGRIYFLGRGS